MSLYKKYRPQTFEDVMGNEAELESFKEALSNPNGPHVFLLTGPSGCGKTTLARIASKELKADSLSITEVNASNNRGIDTARDIIEQLQYAPPSGIRVWIMDEVHMSTKEWQEAMLKPLEDYPSHTYFFLCTTNPEKLKTTLKNRCTKVRVETQEPSKLYRLLRRVATKEEMDIDKEILEEISENCEGSPRTALVLLEKVNTLDDVEEMKKIIQNGVGEEENAEAIELCRALMKKNVKWKEVSEILKKLKDVDAETIRYIVLGYMNSVLLNNGNRETALILECFEEPFYNSKRAGLTLACYKAINL